MNRKNKVEIDFFAKSSMSRDEIIDGLVEMISSWTDDSHPYYQDLSDFIGDMMIEEDAAWKGKKKKKKKKKKY